MSETHHICLVMLAVLGGSLLLAGLASPRWLVRLACRLIAFAEAVEILQDELRALSARCAAWFAQRQESLRKIHGVERVMTESEA